MAIVKCRECGADVSTNAAACPKCGSKQYRRTISLGQVVIVSVLGIVGIRACSDLQGPPPQPAVAMTKPAPARAAATSASTPPRTESVSAQPAASPPAPQSEWRYSSTEDAMGRGASRVASVLSSNTFEFDFPYRGQQHASLTIRNHPRHGNEVILQVERGQFMCSSITCTVNVRFDDGKASQFSGVPPESNDSTVVFIENYQRFMSGLTKAKRVRIEATFFQQGARVMDFNVTGLDTSKLRAK